MWARRCGAPPKWPSRVKVFLMSIGTLAIGLAVYHLLAGDDVSYLDLHNPVSEQVLCIDQWPLRPESPMDLFETKEWDEWYSYRFEEDAFIRRHKCSPEELQAATCRQVRIPMTNLGRALGRPLGIGNTISYDILDSYAWLFLLLAGWLWLQVLAHDLSLLASANKDFVLDLSGIREQFPCVKKVFSLMGCSLLRMLCSQRNCQSSVGKIMGLLCMILWAPVAVAWSLVIFLGVAVPLVAMIFLINPARMSRFGAFLASICCAIYGLTLAIHNLVYLFDPSTRAEFAVTWPAGSGCTCGCVYRLSTDTVAQFALVGGVTVVKACFLAVRCLKGLRRSNWANLLSVTFPVPVTAYAVEWTAWNKKPIKGRVEEGPMRPVQGELAFDPFAMMDEQPDSRSTTLHLKPVKIKRLMFDSRGVKRPSAIRKMEGPNMDLKQEVVAGEYIGCCGFPCRTGGQHVHFSDLEDTDGMGLASGSDCDASGHLMRSATASTYGRVRMFSHAKTMADSVLLSENPSGGMSNGIYDGSANDANGSRSADARRGWSRNGGRSEDSPESECGPKPGRGKASMAVALSMPVAAALAEAEDEESLRQTTKETTKHEDATSSDRRVRFVAQSSESLLLTGKDQESVPLETSMSRDFSLDECGVGEEHLFDESVARLGFEVVWPGNDGELPTVWTVKGGSEADKRGFRRGDVILELNGVSTCQKQRSELYPLLLGRPLQMRVEGSGWRRVMSPDSVHRPRNHGCTADAAEEGAGRLGDCASFLPPISPGGLSIATIWSHETMSAVSSPQHRGRSCFGCDPVTQAAVAHRAVST